MVMRLLQAFLSQHVLCHSYSVLRLVLVKDSSLLVPVSYTHLWVSNIASSLNAILMYSVIFAKSVMNFLIGMIIALYILLDEINLKRQIKKVLYALLPEKTTKSILRTCLLYTSKMCIRDRLDSYQSVNGII